MAEYPTWQSETIDTKQAPERKQARQGVEKVKDEALSRGKGIIEGQKNTASDTAHRIASALENVARDLENDQPQFASVFHDGARALDNFSRTLHDRDTEGLLRQAQDFARRQPALVIGGTIAAGFLLSRILKSSPQREEGAYSSFREGASSGMEPYSTSGTEGFSTRTVEEEKTYGSE
jgi:hypothetical protein